MASYEEFETWHAARNGADPQDVSGGSNVPPAEFGVKLLMGDDPLPPLPKRGIEELI